MREWLFGRQAVRESLYAGRRQHFRLWLAEGMPKAPILDDITAEAQKRHIPIEVHSRQDIAQATGVDEHQGVALETSAYPYVTTADMLALAEQRGEVPLLLMLDLVQDVHNLGTLLRTAEAVGVHGVIIPERRAAGVTPAAVNTSSGAVEHLLVAQVTNLVQEIERLKKVNVWIAGLEDVGGARPYTEIKLTFPVAIVVGNEAEGVRRLVRERCDWLMFIPMRGKINSLNVAVAGSLALYEALRQRSQKTATIPAASVPRLGAV